MSLKLWGVALAMGALTSLSAAAADQNADNASEGLGEIIVTGTRLVVTNGDNLPTPVTVVIAEQLLTTTPSNIPDGLNKLPAFALSRNTANLNNPTDNFTGNFLNLRGLGIQRNLVLLDGHRVAPTSYTGAVDVNTLPELLLQRVDMVTGGASAVYGSDAVSGVVNFILNKNFEGIQANAQYGISDYSDAKSFRVGLVAGTKLFDNRGHVEVSYEHFHQNGISAKEDRPNGRADYAVAGSGTPTDPFRLITNARNGLISSNGSILTPPLAGSQFVSPGQFGPMVHGTPQGGTLESGGDGFYGKGSSITADLTTDQVFARFDYDLTDHLNVYVQGSYARSVNSNNFYPLLFFTGGGPPFVAIAPDNPYLSASTQAALGGTPFLFGRILYGTQWGVLSDTNNVSVSTGLTAKLGDYNLDVNYQHGQSATYNNFIGDWIYGRLDASLDAVDQGLFSGGAANGKIVCRATLTNPTAYPGCVPMNPFGTTVDSMAAALNYARGTQYNRPKFTLDDFEASLAGPTFEDWAGPIQSAVSIDLRRLGMDVTAQHTANEFEDCTGLRFNCTPGVSPYTSNEVTPVSAKQTVAEVALETDIPLLRDKLLAKDLSLNAAGRYTHYSTSGSVETWKVGLDWQITDSIKLRGTRSRDIRAPSLFDLYQPATLSSTGYQDLHTGFNGIVNTETGGNPNLVPEKADTITFGVVFHPSFLEGFSAAIDYYHIKIANAIAQIDGRLAAIQKLCEDSNGTSSFCALYVRPFPFSNTTTANAPTLVKLSQLNASEVTTWGIDGEVNYRVAMGTASHLSLRGLVGYQPKYTSVLAPGFTPLEYAGVASQQSTGGVPKLRVTGIESYGMPDWSLDLQERWRSSLKWDANPTVVYALPDVASVAYTDVTLSWNIAANAHRVVFASVQNVFNKQPPIYLTNGTSGTPDFSFPGVSGDDLIGRYFTVGFRFKL